MRKIVRVAALVSVCAALCSAAPFRRGDANQDGKFDIADSITILGYLFGGGTSTCLDALDVNDDGKVDVADPIKLLGHLFAGDLFIPPPFPDCGNDPSEDSLTCAVYNGPNCVTLAVGGIEPASGPAAGGTAVVITGQGFEGGNFTATLCGNPLTNIVVVSDTRVEAVTPAGAAGTVCNLMISTSQGSAALPGAFTYELPPLKGLGIAPSNGPSEGGTLVTITGEGFQGGNLRATLCSVALTGVHIINDTTLEGVTPAGTPGAVCALRITTLAGSATLSNAFTYDQLPPPDCYTDAELKQLMEDQLGIPFCLPSPAYDGDVSSFHVVACPPDRAGTCDDGSLGCNAVIESATPVIDYANGKAQADLTGSSKLPIDVNSTQCTMDITLAGRVSMDVIFADTQWPGIRRVADVRNLAIQVLDLKVKASGGLICSLLAAASDSIKGMLQDELDARAPEFEAEIKAALVGQYICP